MADTPDFTRLADTLTSRQDQHQQQLDRLTALATSQDEMNRRLEASALRSEELHRSAAETHRRLDAGLAEAQATNRRLDASLAKTDEILATFGQVQLRMLDEMEKLRAEQVRSNRVQEEYAKKQEEYARRQEEFAKRQDEFNVVFLEEIRHIKQDARVYHAQTTLTMQQYDERLKRLEDFMNGFQSAV